MVRAGIVSIRIVRPFCRNDFGANVHKDKFGNAHKIEVYWHKHMITTSEIWVNFLANWNLVLYKCKQRMLALIIQ